MLRDSLFLAVVGCEIDSGSRFQIGHYLSGIRWNLPLGALQLWMKHFAKNNFAQVFRKDSFSRLLLSLYANESPCAKKGCHDL